MKVSELIKQLEEFKQKHGDTDVMVKVDSYQTASDGSPKVNFAVGFDASVVWSFYSCVIRAKDGWII